MAVMKWILFAGVWVFASCSRDTERSFLTADLVSYADLAADKTDPCEQSINYAPDEQFPGHTPMRYVNLRFHVMRPFPGDTNTFDTLQARTYVADLMKQANERLEKNLPMALPPGNNTPALEFRYRYVLDKREDIPDDDGIEFHYDDDLAFFNSYSSRHGHYSKEAFKKYGNPDDNALDVFMFEHHPDSVKSPTYRAKSTGTGFPDWFRLTGAKQFYDTIVTAEGWSYTTPRSVLMNHEMGHTLGLSHTWGGNDGCDDTPNHPNCWDYNSASCPDGIYSNNMMDYNNISRALTPCQLGRIHYNFSKLNSSQRKILVPVWCGYSPDATIWINSLREVEWNSARDLIGDVVVTNGSQLTIRCRVSLPKGARIIVKPRGRLLLDGAHLTNLCGDEWAGIEIERKGKERGRVIFTNSPVLEHMANPLDAPGMNQ